MYLIQGVFFQNYSRLGIQWESEVHGGVKSVIRTALAQFFVFHGIIGKALEGQIDNPMGEVYDQFGKARLTDVEISEAKFSFVKNYEHRNYGIRYAYQKQADGTWAGEYEGPPHTGSGFTRCVLVEVSDDFLIPPPEVLERAKREYKAERAEEAKLLVEAERENEEEDLPF